MNLFTILNANNYMTVNREIARVMGLNAALILSEIINKYCYFEAQGLLEDEWFYLTIEDVEERTTLARDAQSAAIQILKDWGFIETKQRGMPAKRHFRIFKEKITEWVFPVNKKAESRKQDVGIPENKSEEFPKTAPIYKRTEEDLRQETPTPLKKGTLLVAHGSFVKLKEEEYKELCDTNTKESVDSIVEEINDYLASTGKKPYKDYPATIRNWIRRRKNQVSHVKTPNHTNPNQQSNLEAFRKVCEHLRLKGRPIKINLRGKYVYEPTGDSISLDLPPEQFLEILCKWNNLEPK